MTDGENIGGGEGDGALGEHEEPTKIELGSDYVLGAGRRLAVALHEAGRAVDESLDLVAESRGPGAVLALEEIERYLAELVPRVKGSIRAVGHIRAAARRNGIG